MPFISVRMLEGRDQDQKRELVKAITDSMADICGADPRHVHVVIEEIPGSNWAREGVMAADRGG